MKRTLPALIASLITMSTLFAAERVAEAPLPDGFHEPPPVGEVVLRTVPAHRAVEGKNFRACFNHIKKHDIPMTAPVVMTMDTTADQSLDMRHMRFLYPENDAGVLGDDGDVTVVDIPAQQYLSVCVRGSLNDDRRDAIAAGLRQRVSELEEPMHIAGPVEVLGYNSPFQLPWKKLWVVQVPVAPAVE